MSTQPLIQYLIVVNDFPGMKEKRIEIREQHLAAVKKNDHVKAGGAFFSKDPTPEDPMPFAGSAIIMEAESKEKVIQRLKEDVYYKNGVWDVDNAQITPMKLAVLGTL